MKALSRNLASVLAMAAIGLAISSCATAPAAQGEAKESYGPENSALVYGSAKQVRILLSAGKIDSLELVQLNPSGKPMIVTPDRVSAAFHAKDIPVGSSLKFFFFVVRSGNTITSYYRGAQGRGPADFRVTKPGLLYLGSLVYANAGYAKTHKFSADYDAPSWDLYPAGEDSELDILKAILPHYRRTAWEGPINDRIKELKK